MQVSTAQPTWVEIVKRYTTPDHKKSAWQLINSVVPFFAIWVLMVYSLHVSYLITLALAFLNSLFLMRIFIIQHDCGHNSFFKSTKLNNFVGTLLGVITLTPYYSWRNSHAKHHASSGDLDFHGFGDVDTVTVEEYRTMKWWGKVRYRFYRHPLVMFVIGPTLLFVVFNRFPTGLQKSEKREREQYCVDELNSRLGFHWIWILAWIQRADHDVASHYGLQFHDWRFPFLRTAPIRRYLLALA